jgi:hypothetical protein
MGENSKKRRKEMKRLITIPLIVFTFMTALSCSKTPHQKMIGKYQFSESKTIQHPEYASLRDTEQLKKDMRLIIDSVLEITQDTISWKAYDEIIMAGKYTVKNENKKEGKIDLILNTDDGYEQAINIGILDDLHIVFLVEQEDAPPLVFRRGSTANDSAGKARRENEYKTDVANQTAESAINNIKHLAMAAAIDFEDTIDLESMKENGIVDEDVSIEILNNRIDSLVVVVKHKSGDTEYILDSSGEITPQKILSNDEILSIVKNGNFTDVPYKTVSTAINEVMESPSWNVTKGTDGRYYVNVEGTIILDNEPVRAHFQMNFDTTNEIITPTGLLFNGEAPNKPTIVGFFDALFEPSKTSDDGNNKKRKITLKHDGIVIKGLYIGMTIDQAHEVVTGQVDETWKVDPVKQSDDTDWFFSAETKDTFMDGIYVWAKNDRMVYSIKLGSSAVAFLFNVSDMDGEEFAQAIVNNYDDIPGMEADIEERDMISQAFYSEFSELDTGPKMYWKYKDPSGTLLTIREDKELRMERITGAGERKFD